MFKPWRARVDATRMRAVLLLSLAWAFAPPAASSELLKAPRTGPEDVLLERGDVERSWEIVEEAGQDVERDPDLVRWGVRAHRARHYTRMKDDVVEVCSIEVWIFRDPGRARAAEQGFSHPGWRFDRENEILIAARGLRRPRAGAAARGVFAACAEIQALTRARAAALPATR
jgi:hypothetical protein